MFKRLFGNALFVVFFTFFAILFSASAFAATYEIPHDDEIEQVKQLQSAKFSQGMGVYSYDANDALRDDLYFYEVNDANRDARLQREVRKGFERFEELASKDVWYVHRELCRDWDWMYDAVMLRVDDSHDFFRFVKSCDDDSGFNDWWLDYWEGFYYEYGGAFPPWLLPHDGSRTCWKAKNYEQFLACRNAYLPHYRTDWPTGYFNLTGKIDYGKETYQQWADYCAAGGDGYLTDWCLKRRGWITGTTSD